MHYEKQPHTYAAALTTTRTGAADNGGHFYLGSYGIKVESAANSLVVWQPRHVHGTGLQLRSPYDKEDPAFIQRGMAIVTSSRLPGVWEKYAAAVGLDLSKMSAEAKKAEEEIYFEKTAGVAGSDDIIEN